VDICYNYVGIAILHGTNSGVLPVLFLG